MVTLAPPRRDPAPERRADPVRVHIAVAAVLMLALASVHLALVLDGTLARAENSLIAVAAIVVANLAGWLAGWVARRRPGG